MYNISFTQNTQIYLQTQLQLESYVGNAYHFQLLKNRYIRNGLLKVNEWYEMDILPIQKEYPRIAGAD